jgi:hypothetical protein
MWRESCNQQVVWQYTEDAAVQRQQNNAFNICSMHVM